ncbi:hypothetical protein AAGN67_14990, partial [Klebsiella pneumoniae]
KSAQIREILISESAWEEMTCLFAPSLEDDLVVFENIEYGNAIYILYDDWDEISKLSRIDLLSGRAGSNFDRIIHSGNWKEEVRKKVATGRL